MGRCVIFALGEILISVLSAAAWMDEPGSLQPRLTFPQHLRGTQPFPWRPRPCPGPTGDLPPSSSLIYLVRLNLMQPLLKWNEERLQEMGWRRPDFWLITFINM